MSKKSLQYTQSLLEDLMQSANLESGVSQLKKETINIGNIISAVLERLQPEITKKNIAVVSHCTGSVSADPKGIEKIFMNLVGNAINYTDNNPHPKIVISSQLQESACLISLKDNGIGIPEDSRATIFDKFRRGSNVKGVHGTGLGLFIVRGIVEAHGGRIWVESEEGKGSTFYFTIPMQSG